jgi:hypothetical protein
MKPGDSIRPEQEAVLSALERAGESGLKKAALTRALLDGRRLGKAPKAEFERALALLLGELVADGEVVDFGTAASPAYVLSRWDRRLEAACAEIESRATPGKATAFTLAALRKGHRKGVGKPTIDEAIQKLVAARKLIAIQPGKTVFYVHARSLAPLVLQGTAGGPAAAPFAAETAREAYAALVRAGGFDDVPISDLQERSGLALPELKAWLLEQSRAGRAVPTRGDWSLASAAARAAAIEIRGEPHLQVRLLE